VVPRFECDACHRQFRLAQASPPTQAVADQLLKALATQGHQGQRVDLSIHGTCNVCVNPADGANGGTPPDAGVS
jgi:Fur family ferric uptake transcriptional regulator